MALDRLDLQTTTKRISASDYSSIQIKIASVEDILSWSFGEVKTSETINYRTFKPERGGLFCAKIFGPTVDYECNCGKYRRMKHRGITCEKCGVEVIQSNVRRERLGHIKLASPVCHVWFLKSVPSRIGNLIDLSVRDLERVLYFESYVVIEPGSSPFAHNELVSRDKYQEYLEEYPDLELEIGAEAIRELLKEIDLETLAEDLRVEMREATSEARRKKVVKRLKVVDSFIKSGNDLASMVLEVLPVLSPELRPLVPLEGGRFATSDLNDLYRRVIHRNNRLKRLIDLRAPQLIVRNEKRMLQEAVDALFDNGRHGKPILGSNKRPLKSLSDMLKGKQGRFRQNLLGKRVDYSGRSVIVVGPELELNQCGLPKVIAIELFKPFIYEQLMSNYEVPTIKIAKRMVDEGHSAVWEVLDKVINQHPIMLNRAPTLHRLGIQAFEPKIIEGKAIQLHPLVCSAFNADFDGDQMAVHVPLSIEARLEAKILMMSTNNVLSPANGRPTVIPGQDIVLGLYWLTNKMDDAAGEGKVFYSMEDVYTAHEYARVSVYAGIKVHYGGQVYDTTVGRCLLYRIVPEGVPFEVVNQVMKKKALGNLVSECHRLAGDGDTVKMLDQMKTLGFKYATKAGFSISIQDMEIPKEKPQLLEAAQKDVLEVRQQYLDGLITEGERYNKVIDIWARLTDTVAETMLHNLANKDKSKPNNVNPIFVMADSGARGSTQQMKQLAGMRGLMAKPSGEIIETPITANFREGLSVLQYFISTHGARKGLADTALKTANSGYLTRRLVDVAQDGVITEYDCGSIDGIEISALIDAGEIIETLGDRVLGRVALFDVVSPYDDSVIVKANEEIDEEKIARIETSGIERVHIRSVLSCNNSSGLCALCYGRDLSRGRLVGLGEAVGVIAAQSIGEPGTQLTMRTFHIGGAASQRGETSSWPAKFSGVLDYSGARVVKTEANTWITMTRNFAAAIIDDNKRELESRTLPTGTQFLVPSGTEVKRGDKIAEWDPYAVPIICDVAGKANFKDIIDGVTVREQLDKETGLSRRVILESSGTESRPEISVCKENGLPVKHPDTGQPAHFILPAKAELMVEDGQEVMPGSVLARIPREILRNRDITGGLPRIAELFEARIPKNPSIISEIDGVVSFGKDIKRKQKVIVTPEHGEPREYLVTRGKHVIVQDGDFIKAGDSIVDGLANPHDILAVRGTKELQRYLVDEIQEVYRLQGVGINDKHIEVIVRQMLKQVNVIDPGDTSFLTNENVSRYQFELENDRVRESGQQLATAKPVLQGITRAALSTESFISAASFQETTKILTEAAVSGSIDTFGGLKENVILGRLIPTGTGFPGFKNRTYSVVEGAEAGEAIDGDSSNTSIDN